MEKLLEEIKLMSREEFAEFLIEDIHMGSASTSDVMTYLRAWTEGLEHHKHSTTGLWATDKPEMVDDPKSVLFQI